MQFAFNTLSRVTPVAHGVCNVVKRVCIIGTSVVFFGNAMTNQTKLGTVIALIGEQQPKALNSCPSASQPWSVLAMACKVVCLYDVPEHSHRR